MDLSGCCLLVHCPLPDADGVQCALSPRDMNLFPLLLAPLFRCRPPGCTVGTCSRHDRRRVPQPSTWPRRHSFCKGRRRRDALGRRLHQKLVNTRSDICRNCQILVVV
jgi:hypothetical protein